MTRACSTTSRPSGSPGCAPPPTAARFCSRPRWWRATAAAAAATTPGARKPSSSPGSSPPPAPRQTALITDLRHDHVLLGPICVTQIRDKPAPNHRPGVAWQVAGLDQHPGDGPGPVRALQDADLVVGQLEPGQLRVEPLQREAQGVVERVDRPVALAGGHDPLALGPELHGGLADHLAARAPLDDDAPRLDLEVAQPLPGQLVAEQQLEGGV